MWFNSEMGKSWFWVDILFCFVGFLVERESERENWERREGHFLSSLFFTELYLFLDLSLLFWIFGFALLVVRE